MEREESDLETDWKEDVETPKASKYLLILAVITFLFFLAAVGIASFVRIAGIDRTVSTSKITIVTQGEKVVEGGSTVPLTIRIANRNPVPIWDVTFEVDYPPGSYRKQGDGIVRPTGDMFNWDVIDSGEVVSGSVVPLLYGTAGEKKTITYTLTYRAEGSMQPTRVKETYDVLLRTAPLLLGMPQYSNPVAGKEITFTVKIQSNTAKVTPKSYVQLTYPPGFTPRSFSPEPFDAQQTSWTIKQLKPNEEQIITVRGVIRGTERDEQSIVARLFAVPTGDPAEATVIAEESAVLTIAKSFLDIGLKFGNEQEQVIIVSPGDEVDVDIAWSNLDLAQLEDVVITAQIAGTGLNESSIRSNRGYFDEVKREIVWDKKQLRSFASVSAGESGILSFKFNALPNRIEFSQPQKNVQVRVSARAKRISTGKTERIQNIAVGRVNVRSVLQATGTTLYQTSTIENSGPIPPRVGQRTTYVLKYFIKNSGNDLANVSLSVPLRRDVEMTGSVSGLSAQEWSHDEETNTIQVAVPTMTATGLRSGRSIEFQVAFTPSSRDAGQEVILADEAVYEARDTFVDEVFKGTISELTTRITSEPFDYRSGVVVE